MTPATAPAGRPRSAPANIVSLLGREARDALRSRWFLLYSLAFAVLGLGVSYVSATSLGGSGLAGFGRTTAGLINLVLLVVPLMGLTAGAGAIAGERERGTLAYLLAQPVSRWEVLLGKYAGLALTLVASVSLGFGLSAAVMAWQGSHADPGGYLLLTGLSLLLGLSMLSLGLLIGCVARRGSAATGIAIFVWLALVFVTDLVLMAGTLAFRIPVQRLFFLGVLNPLQAFKMWSLDGVEASLDVLGPAGLYGQETFGAALPWMFGGSLAAWGVAPLLLAGVIFSRRTVT